LRSTCTLRGSDEEDEDEEDDDGNCILRSS
jgi:hypothetical protein